MDEEFWKDSFSVKPVLMMWPISSLVSPSCTVTCPPGFAIKTEVLCLPAFLSHVLQLGSVACSPVDCTVFCTYPFHPEGECCPVCNGKYHSLRDLLSLNYSGCLASMVSSCEEVVWVQSVWSHFWRAHGLPQCLSVVLGQGCSTAGSQHHVLQPQGLPMGLEIWW